MSEVTETYRAIDADAGFADRSGRDRLDVTGPDRAKFLHNLTTNDIKRLDVGHGMEAFITSPQGKTLGYCTLLGCEDRIVLLTDAGGVASVLPHLTKYGAFDEVALDDVGAQTFIVHVVGPRADEILKAAGAELPDAGDLRHRETTVAGKPVRIARESPAGRPGLTILGTRGDSPAIAAQIHESGAPLGLVDISADAFDVLRIEAGTPVFGRDVTADNLPQEVGRDARAISFVKGCYLGQETVARIDAMGHVNKHLKGVRFLEPVGALAEGTELQADGKRVGAVTSSAFSPGWGALVALGYVRSAHAAAGTVVSASVAEKTVRGTICDLPMLPPKSTA
jgi:folate-binding protein YgfZ